MKVANPKLYHRITEERAGETELPYLVYCANCREVFLSRGKDCRHVLEGIIGKNDRVFTISEKHGNLLRLKGEFMQMMEGTRFVPEVHEWDSVVIRVLDAVRSDMEENLISDEDVKQCIFRSVNSNERFTDGSGVYLACLVCRVVTFWVEYSENTDGSYSIHNAYSHRMHFDKGEGK